MLFLSLPGVAGQAGAEQSVSNGDVHKVLVQPRVHPAVWNDVGAVAYGTTWTQTGHRHTHQYANKSKAGMNVSVAAEQTYL